MYFNYLYFNYFTTLATKYIIGGIYRHPNRRMLEFTDAIDPVLRKISCQTIIATVMICTMMMF